MLHCGLNNEQRLLQPVQNRFPKYWVKVIGVAVELLLVVADILVLELAVLLLEDMLLVVVAATARERLLPAAGGLDPVLLAGRLSSTGWGRVSTTASLLLNVGWLVAV